MRQVSEVRRGNPAVTSVDPEAIAFGEQFDVGSPLDELVQNSCPSSKRGPLSRQTRERKSWSWSIYASSGEVVVVKRVRRLCLSADTHGRFIAKLCTCSYSGRRALT